jgi:hypothetical protein
VDKGEAINKAEQYHKQGVLLMQVVQNTMFKGFQRNYEQFTFAVLLLQKFKSSIN